MDGDPAPAEWELLQAIRKFGVANVIGNRVLSAGETRRMNYIENEYNAHAAKVRKVLSGK